MIKGKSFYGLLPFPAFIAFLISVLLWNMFSGVRKHSQFLNYMEIKIGNIDQPMPDTITFGNYADEHGRAVIIKDHLAINKIVSLLNGKNLVQTQDYQKNQPIEAGETIIAKFDFGSKAIEGPFRVGGKSNIGFGFLLEQKQDDHWFYGAWDPWPVEAYWINLHPYEWINEKPDDSLSVLLYEIFTFLFFAPVQGVDLHVNEDGFSYSFRNPDIRSESKEAEDLLRVGSMRDFLKIHPEFKLKYTNRE